MICKFNKSFLLGGALIFFSLTGYSQREVEENSGFSERLYFGGNFWAQFNPTYVEISPSCGYMFNNKLSTGLGLIYIHKKSYNLPPPSTSNNIYGFRTFVRRNIGRQFFVHSEFEDLNLQLDNPSAADGIYRDWVPGLFLGGGLFQPIGQRGGFMITALYNVLYDDMRSPYNSPVVLRLGFTF